MPIGDQRNLKPIYDWFKSINVGRYRLIVDPDLIEEMANFSKIQYIYPEVKTVALVNNPWSSIAFNFLSKKTHNSFTGTFDDYVASLHPSCQLDYLEGIIDNTYMRSEYILRNEFLTDDFKKLQEYFKTDIALELPNKNNFNYRVFYNDNTKKEIERIFERDIIEFGYTF
jgi:hypothetical protein